VADYGADQYRWEHGILKGHEGHGCNWDQGGRAPCPDEERRHRQQSQKQHDSKVHGHRPGYGMPHKHRAQETAYQEDCIAAVETLLRGIGEDPDREGLEDTPKRYVKALLELTEGYREDPAEILETQFDVPYDQMVVVSGIEFTSLCEHHILPFTGKAVVGYIPRDRVVGLSKIARVVHVFARRLQVQERLTQQIAEAIQEHVEPIGVGVVVTATHQCMTIRGAKEDMDAKMTTSALLGVMRDSPDARAEFLALARTNGGHK